MVNIPAVHVSLSLRHTCLPSSGPWRSNKTTSIATSQKIIRYGRHCIIHSRFACCPKTNTSRASSCTQKYAYRHKRKQHTNDARSRWNQVAQTLTRCAPNRRRPRSIPHSLPQRRAQTTTAAATTTTTTKPFACFTTTHRSVRSPSTGSRFQPFDENVLLSYRMRF
jgi:hypothetical protein